MKTPLLIITIVVLAVALFLSDNRNIALEEENSMLRAPDSSSSAAEQTGPAVSEMVDDDEKPFGIVTGSASGTLGYPSEYIPAMDVYAFNKEEDSYVIIKTAENQSTFSFPELEVGTYTFIAYPTGSNGKNAGAYSKFVPCGLSVSCTDHSLIEVQITAGDEATGIEIKDWYAPAGSFPGRP